MGVLLGQKILGGLVDLVKVSFTSAAKTGALSKP